LKSEREELRVVGRFPETALSDYLELVDRPMAMVNRERVLWANASLAKLLSVSRTDLVEMPLTVLSHDEIVTTSLRIQLAPCDLRHATGLRLPAEARAVPLSQSTWMVEFSVRRAVGVDEELEVYKERLWTLADQVPVGIFFSEVGMRLQYVNDRLSEIFEVPTERLVGMGWLALVSDHDRELVEDSVLTVLKGARDEVTVDIVTGTGATKRVLMHFAGIQSSDGGAGFVGTVEDITDRVANEERLTFAATHDPLTGLPNRSGLTGDLLSMLEAVRKDLLSGVMLVFCDLDEFKAINDNLGHLAGDRLLIETANRLRLACQEGHRVFRYAGDEFVVLCPDVGTPEAATAIAVAFERAIDPPIVLAGVEISLSASIGYSLSLSGDTLPDALLVEADRAMYQVKAARKQVRRARGTTRESYLDDQDSDGFMIKEAW
jgi:diguanylate cyclase (GGDEF)-like protein/PAS domain S-box-containing protein